MFSHSSALLEPIIERPLDIAPLHVGIFSNAFHPTVSGVVNSVELIHRQLQRAGNHCDLFVPSPDPVSMWRAPWMKNESAQNHPDIHYFPSFRPLPAVDYAFGWPLARAPWKKVLQLPLDVVHTHHPMWLGHIGRYIAYKRKIPLVFTFHTQYDQYLHYLPLPQWLTRPVLRWRVQSFLNHCQLVVAPSQLISDYLKEFRVSSRVEVLANAIDLTAFQQEVSPNIAREQIRQQLGLHPDVRLALYAGRLGKEKNLEFLLRSFALSSQGQRDRHLLVVGEGLERAQLMALSESLGLQEQVTFTGRVDYSKMPAYYHCADFFAMSSVTEVKPLVVLEALAAGLPVLAVAACGTADTVSDGVDGWLCREKLEEHADLFCRAFCSDLKPLSLAAVAKARDFSIVTYVDKLTQLYREEIARLAGA